MKPHKHHSRRHMLALGLAAAMSGAAFAQEAPPAPPASGASAPPPPHGKGHHPGGRLKEQLKLTEAQEAAWKQFTDAMHPPAPPATQEREDWFKLTTPQRLDRMQALADKHHAAMRQRHDAIRTFYAQLSDEQKKVFDDYHARRPPFGHSKHPGKRGPRHGTPGGPPPRESK